MTFLPRAAKLAITSYSISKREWQGAGRHSRPVPCRKSLRCHSHVASPHGCSRMVTAFRQRLEHLVHEAQLERLVGGEPPVLVLGALQDVIERQLGALSELGQSLLLEALHLVALVLELAGAAAEDAADAMDQDPGVLADEAAIGGLQDEPRHRCGIAEDADGHLVPLLAHLLDLIHQTEPVVDAAARRVQDDLDLGAGDARELLE